MLLALGVDRARILVLSFDTELAAIKTLRAAREVSKVPILVRSRDHSSIERLHDAGADEVVAETLEASLGLGDRVLSRLSVADEKIAALLNRERDTHYPAASRRDRKSTRLNSSHDQISYAVFCLKKKKQGNLRKDRQEEQGAR